MGEGGESERLQPATAIGASGRHTRRPPPSRGAGASGAGDAVASGRCRCRSPARRPFAGVGPPVRARALRRASVRPALQPERMLELGRRRRSQEQRPRVQLAIRTANAALLHNEPRTGLRARASGCAPGPSTDPFASPHAGPQGVAAAAATGPGARQLRVAVPAPAEPLAWFGVRCSLWWGGASALGRNRLGWHCSAALASPLPRCRHTSEPAQRDGGAWGGS